LEFFIDFDITFAVSIKSSISGSGLLINIPLFFFDTSNGQFETPTNAIFFSKS
jgi:hypothetical protein